MGARLSIAHKFSLSRIPRTVVSSTRFFHQGRFMYKHILVATDGSKLSDKAVNAALDLARSLGARVRAFYATPEVSMTYGEGYMYAPQRFRKEFIKQRDAHARRL